jgi:hypothetical protein
MSILFIPSKDFRCGLLAAAKRSEDGGVLCVRRIPDLTTKNTKNTNVKEIHPGQKYSRELV